MKRDRDPRRGEWLEALVRGVHQEISGRVRGREVEPWNIFMVTFLQTALVTNGREPGRFGGHAFSMAEAGDELLVGRRVMRRYLREAAQAGLIKCVSWYDVRAKQRFPLEVIVNPDLAEAYGKTTLADARALGKAFAGLYLARRDYLEAMQGFSLAGTVPWGRMAGGQGPETAASPAPEEHDLPAIEVQTPDVLVARIRAAAKGGTKTVSALKQEEREKARTARDQFVTGAAVVWRELQSRRGFGSEPPGWAGSKAALPPAQRRERTEIEKVFERYGGRRAAFAWALFCGGRPVLDDKGKLAFKPELAHQQWTTPDKKPSHFAKHIDLVLAHLGKVDWEKDSGLTGKLLTIFGETFDAAPRAVVSLPTYNGGSHGDPQAARA